MAESRYLKICFEKLKVLAERYPNEDPKYNSCLQTKELFFKNIDVENIYELFTIETLKNNNKFLLSKLQRFYLQNDFEKSENSNFLFFSDMFNYRLSSTKYFSLRGYSTLQS